MCSVKNGGFIISVRLWYEVVCVWCDKLCRIVVVGSRVFIDTACYGVFCFVIVMFSCAWYVLLVAWQCFVNIQNTVIPRLTSDPANEFFG